MYQYVCKTAILRIILFFISIVPGLSVAEQGERLLHCQFHTKYKNSEGTLSRDHSAYPGYILFGKKHKLLIKANSKNIYILKYSDDSKKYSPLGTFQTVSFSGSINEASTNIRGITFNKSVPNPYFEAVVINTSNKPYEITFFDSVTASVAIGSCNEIAE